MASSISGERSGIQSRLSRVHNRPCSANDVAARRCALSRSIRALCPSRTSAAFSDTPVICFASANNCRQCSGWFSSLHLGSFGMHQRIHQVMSLQRILRAVKTATIALWLLSSNRPITPSPDVQVREGGLARNSPSREL